MEDAGFDKVMEYLRRICSAREYCSKDIHEKALKRLEDPAKAQKAVQTLQEEGFLSDLRYACAFARDKSTIAGWGEVKIRHMLRAKGISGEVMEEALGARDTEKAGIKLRKLLETKYKALKGDPQAKLKLLRFALSRGYTYDQVSGPISELLRKTE